MHFAANGEMEHDRCERFTRVFKNNTAFLSINYFTPKSNAFRNAEFCKP